MSRYALIRTDAPASVIRYAEFEAAPELAQAKGLKWIPDVPPPYDSAIQTRAVMDPMPVDAEQVLYLVTDIPLADLRAARKDAVTQLFRAKADGGLVLGGVTVATTHEAMVDLREAQAKLATMAPAELPVVNRARQKVTLTPVIVDAMIIAIQNHRADCQVREHALYDAIEAAGADAQMTHAARAAEILAVDIEAGWPSNV